MRPYCKCCVFPLIEHETHSARYRISEALVHMPYSRAITRLEKDQEDLNNELSQFRSQTKACEKEMGKRKTSLYGNFGKAINLDE